MRRGALVLVVGPSGAGKDTLIDLARRELAADERFVFPRRVVTREALVDSEDHDTMTPEQFALRQQCGGFALHWRAHGLSYGVPAAGVEAAMMVGRTVVANVSRAVVADATARYADCKVVLVSAPPEVRAARLAARRRETEDEIRERLAREGAPLPTGVFATIVDNSAAIEDGLRRFLKVLTSIAA